MIMQVEHINKYFNSNPAIFLLAIASLVGFSSFMSLKLPMSEWHASNLSFDYGFEYIKRGLPGQFIHLFFGNNLNLLQLQNIALGIYGIFVGLLVIFFFIFFRFNPLLAFAILISGFSLQQFGYEIGRVDQINFIILLLCIFCSFIRQLPSMLNLIIQCCGCLTMLLVHEAAILLFIPLLLSLQYFRKEPIGLLIFLFIFSSLCFCLNIYFGKLNTHSFEELVLYSTNANTGFNIDSSALSIYEKSLSDNILNTLDRLFSKKTLSRMLLIIVVSLPALLIIKACFIQITKERSSVDKLAFIFPAIAVIPLFFLGIDFYRWISILLFCYFLLITSLIHHLKLKLNISYKYILAAIIFGIYSGPYGITVALPERLQLIGL